jgi:anti-sigma regulatory factor (Ser/Thr protein kinase)
MTDLTLRLDGDQGQARIVRDHIRNWAATERLSEDGSGNAIFVASELFSNAVTAAESGTQIDVRLTHVHQTVEVVVENTGPAFDPALLEMPAPTDSRGRGIALARLLGALTVSHADGRTGVRVVLND